MLTISVRFKAEVNQSGEKYQLNLAHDFWHDTDYPIRDLECR